MKGSNLIVEPHIDLVVLAAIEEVGGKLRRSDFGKNHRRLLDHRDLDVGADQRRRNFHPEKASADNHSVTAGQR